MVNNRGHAAVMVVRSVSVCVFVCVCMHVCVHAFVFVLVLVFLNNGVIVFVFL